MKTVNPFYKSARWQKKRAAVMRRDQYECRECRRYGRVTPATMVHHVKPFEDYPELKLSSNNLISLCNSCHGTFHDRNTNELTTKGIEWIQRIEKIKN